MSPWLGWLAFAAIILSFGGVLQVIAAFVTLFRSHYYEVNTAVLVVDESWTTLGWTQLILGVVVTGAGIALLRGYLWARLVAVVVAGLTIVENVLSMAVSPVWNMLLIALALVSMYAVIVHGQEGAAD